MAARPPHRAVSGINRCCPLRVHFMTLSRAFHSGAREAAVVEQTRAALVSIAATNWQEAEVSCRFCGVRTLLGVCNLLTRLRSHAVLTPALAHAVVALNRDDWVEMVGEARYEKFTYVWRADPIDCIVLGFSCALERLALPDTPVTDPVAVALTLDALANIVGQHLVTNLSVAHLDGVLAVMRRHADAAVIQAAGNLALWRIIEAGLQITAETDRPRERDSWNNSCEEVVAHIVDAVRRHPVAPVERHALGVLSVYGKHSSGFVAQETLTRLCEWLGQYLRVCAFVPDIPEVTDTLRMTGRSFQYWTSAEAVDTHWLAQSACFAYYRRPECRPQDLIHINAWFWQVTAPDVRDVPAAEREHFITLLANDVNLMPLLLNCVELGQEAIFRKANDLLKEPQLRRAAQACGAGAVLVRAVQAAKDPKDYLSSRLSAVTTYAKDEATHREVVEAGGLEACMDWLDRPMTSVPHASGLRASVFSLLHPRIALNPRVPLLETPLWDQALPFARAYICAHDRRLLWPWFEAALRFNEEDDDGGPAVPARAIDYEASDSLRKIARGVFDTW